MLSSYFLVVVLTAQYHSGDIWIERNNKVFNSKSWHNHKETKAHLGQPSGLCESCLAEMLMALQAGPGSENETSPGL